MFEPITLTLEELAARWKRTPRQLLEAALYRDFPLYFFFDGLVFELSDEWLQSNGDWAKAREIESIQRGIDSREQQLRRNLSHRRGELKLTEWEQELTDDETVEIRSTIDSDARELQRLSEALEQRNIERHRCRRNGLLRAAPGTLQAVMERGTDEFPRRAYDPDSPVSRRPSPVGRGVVLDGRLLALEDAFHPKENITTEDLFARMSDVRAIEAVQNASSAHVIVDPKAGQVNDVSNPTMSREQMLGWLDVAMDGNFWFRQPSVSPAQAAMLLCEINPNAETEADALASTNELTGPADYTRLLNAFQALENASASPRTLLDWRNYAQERALKYHAWIELWLELLQEELSEAIDLLAPRSHAGPAATWVPAPDLDAKPPSDPGKAQGRPWEIADPRDPAPEQPWYIPARYFARALVKDDPTLLTKSSLLLNKIAESLKKAGVKKRGGAKDFQASTLKKALSNVVLG
jgi:hypothetical protein